MSRFALRIRTSLLLGLLAALALGIVLVYSFLSKGNEKADPSTTSNMELKAGSPAPDFELAEVTTGEPVSLSSLRGRPVWINFWATWCPPCKAELPRMKQVYDKYKDKGLVIIGIDMQEDPSQIKQFVESNKYDWTFVVDTDGQVTNRYFTAGIPSHVFIDANGVVQAANIGDLQAPAMEELLGKIISNQSQSGPIFARLAR